MKHKKFFISIIMSIILIVWALGTDTQTWSRSGSKQYLEETGTLFEGEYNTYYLSGQIKYNPVTGQYSYLTKKQLRAIMRLNKAYEEPIILIQDIPYEFQEENLVITNEFNYDTQVH